MLAPRLDLARGRFLPRQPLFRVRSRETSNCKPSSRKRTAPTPELRIKRRRLRATNWTTRSKPRFRDTSLFRLMLWACTIIQIALDSARIDSNRSNAQCNHDGSYSPCAVRRLTMHRLIRNALGLSLISLLPSGNVRAQGWGWDGWGGWAQTPEGALAQGMGHYYTGAGIFNEKTAIADSINLDTLIRWNDYLISRPIWKPPAATFRGSAKTPPIIGHRTTRSSRESATIPPRVTSRWATL